MGRHPQERSYVKDNRTMGQRRPRLIMLTQWFEPEPTFKGLVFARELKEKGFDVEVVTGFPNYPGGKVYDGFNIRLLQRETIGGIHLTRVPLYPSHDRSAFLRIVNYVSFFLSSTFYLIFVARRADILYAYHPPLTVGLAAAVAKLFRKTPTVVDIQDMWPDTLSATGMLNNKSILKLVSRVCHWVYRHVSHIVVLSPGFRSLLIDRGVPNEKITVIYNWADEASISDLKTERPEAMRDATKFRLLFAGNLGRAQGLDTVLDAAKLVAVTNPAIVFNFLGGGLDVDRLTARAEAEKITNVSFLPKVPMTEVGNYLAAADCLLVHLRADPLFAITIPSKTQAYMAAGKPIIMAVDGDAANLVTDSGCGFIVSSENARSLADAVCNLYGKSPADRKEMGLAGRRYYEDQLSLNQGVDKFLAVFHKYMRHNDK
jgi:colanic acid biosynthesis glycosyl transferase WcaI